MMRTNMAAVTAAFLALSMGANACAKKEAPAPPAEQTPPPPPAPLAVASVDLGKAVGPDKKVTGVVATFGVHDTIYASVNTTGAGENAPIGAKWSFVKKDGSLAAVNESSQMISASGPSATEFHILKATPWPKGKYKVEITLNGAVAGSQEFEVQ